MEVECPDCETLCDDIDMDRLLSVINLYFKCENCGLHFIRIYKYIDTWKS